MMPEFVFFTLGVSFRAWAYIALILSSCKAFFESFLSFFRLLGIRFAPTDQPIIFYFWSSYQPLFSFIFLLLFSSFFIRKPSRGRERGL